MLLSGALFALFMTGFWLYCLTDAILTPAPECRGLSKPAWIAVIAVTFIAGALAWLIVRRPVHDSARSMPGLDHQRPDQGDLADEFAQFQATVYTTGLGFGPCCCPVPCLPFS